MFACGRDPYFPAWPDVLQLNAFHPGLRQAVIETISEIAEQCDGIRCDMAMLVLNDIFERTWGARAGAKTGRRLLDDGDPGDQRQASGVQVHRRGVLGSGVGTAAAGIRLLLRQETLRPDGTRAAESVRQHLLADLPYQEGMVRFIENHDEPRAATAFPGRQRVARRPWRFSRSPAPGCCTRDSSRDGACGCRSSWAAARQSRSITISRPSMRRLLKATNRDLFRNGEWRLCERSGWPDNQSCQNILAWCWVKDNERALVVVNFGRRARPGSCPRCRGTSCRSRQWRLDDGLSGDVYDRDGNEMRDSGLYVDLAPWQCHLFRARAL